MTTRFLSADQAVALIPDGAALSVEGSGGGLLEPDLLLAALERRFLADGAPSGLTVVHCTGIGDRRGGGLDRLAHEGLVRRAVGGNWGMAPAMCELAVDGLIEAYNLPQGVMAQLYREIAAGRPGLITHVGIGTFCDPRLEGGRLNDRTTEELVEVLELDGREYLRYRPFPIDACFLRATTADEHGNLSLEEEGARLETLAVAQATRNRGGVVIAQVKRVAAGGSLDPRTVTVPGMLVDVVVEHPAQWQTVEGEHNPAFSGALRTRTASVPPMPLDERKVIARRAAQELSTGDVVNLGVGMSDGVASVVAEEGGLDAVTFTIEQGLVGGVPARGLIFGVSWNPAAILDQPAQFDFYDGGGIDVACLGFAQLDGAGNVNVSRFGRRLVGTGGFVNISQNARTVVFCGTLTVGGLKVHAGGGRLDILQEGRHRKLLDRVEQVTFSGREALARGQRVLYVTERAVFGLTPDGVRLVELAPGVDLDLEVRPFVDFDLGDPAPAPMAAALFRDGPLGLDLRPEEAT